MFRLNWNKQETHPNSLKESIFGYFSEYLGLFRFVSVCYETVRLFRLFRYTFETPKQTEIFCFWFHETNWNKRETDLVSVCFSSNRNKFLFVSRTPLADPFFRCEEPPPALGPSRTNTTSVPLWSGVKMFLSVITAPIVLAYLLDFLNGRCHVNPQWEYSSCKFDPPRLFKI